ncbi:MAG: DUF2231 domain-containing protein [Thermomonas sp.]|uniref:DUF2231 domain-containing protein n=1 Tax=Thermomonas sp. TaxID=1971895 RepID=UPI0026103DE6|nr:DUF2231 domain-containing protein [Thermomonas sp.]MCC7097373.1 DUF2231 domain-containing protein [Thermomonas sp.]
MKHPLHPMLVHFPIAAWLMATVLDGVALVWQPWLLQTFAALLMLVGCATGLIAAAAGFVDLLKLPDGHPALRIVNRHMGMALASWCLYAGSLLLRVQGIQQHQFSLVAPGTVALALSGAGLLAVLATGFLGGTLVYGHGVGTSPRP